MLYLQSKSATMKYILYTILFFSLISMKNFQNKQDISTDLEIVENFDAELTEDLNVEIHIEIEPAREQMREKILHICKFCASFPLDVQCPPPEF